MIVKNKLIEINEDNVFKNDILDRKDVIEDLSKLIISNNEPFVFSINASWGSGKTTFVKLWQTYLKKECDVHSIYFSAWEDDFSKEPLISILGELNTYIEKNFEDNTPIKNNFNKAKEFSGKVLKRGIPAFIKGATAGLIDTDAGFEQAIGAMTEQTAKALIDNYSNDKNVLIEFKKAIEIVLNEIDSEKPFVVFIDELDRCRPLYAIELLERIKHVFGIEKLIFVLSIDKKHLAESIKSQYGDIDTDNYLRRFIDLEYNLSNPSIDKFCDAMYRKFNLDFILKSKKINAQPGEFHHLSIMKKLAVSFKLSLRQIEQIFTKLHIVFKTIEPSLYESHFRVFIFIEMLKSYDSKLYNDFIHGKVENNKIKDILVSKFQDTHVSVYRDISILFEAIIDSVGKTNEEYNTLIKSKEEELLTFSSEESYAHKRLKQYIHFLRFSPDTWDEYRLNKLIDTVINKIEFVDKFNMG